jgi:vacuolar protein sorting-associated protein 13B
MQNLLSNVLSLTPLKRLIATTIQSQLSRFIEGIELDSLGLLGGDLVLENLELRKDVVQELLGIPMAFDLDRGFIKELRIHIPWTRLTSKPIEIKFHTVEIVVVPTKGDAASARKSEARAGSHDEHSSDDTHSDPGDADVDAAAAAVASEAASAPSWTQTLITRALANISLTVENLVLKLDDGEVVLSATLPSFRVHSADPDLGWECRWLNLFGPYQLVHKLVEAKQLTVCLDRYTPGNTPSNKRSRSIVGYERPLLDRVSLTVRLQIPLERRPAFERLEREQLGNRILSEGTQADQDSLAAYGSGDISSGYFDDAYGWAGVDGRSFADGAGSAEKTSTPKLAPVFKLPCASNCGRALAGEVRRPWVRKDDQDPVYTQDGPFDDRDELWVPMPGWSRPDLTLVDPLAEKYSTDDASANTTSAATQVLPSEMPMPNLVADVHCAALNFSFSERQISMLHSLVSLTSGPKEHSALNAHHSPKPLKRNTKAVPRNSPRNHAESDPSQAKAALPEVLQAAPELDPPLQSRSWLSRIFFKDNVNGEAMDNVISEAKHEVGLNSTGSKSTDVGVKKADHSLVIVSVSLPCVTVDLLRHSANADGDLGDSTPVEGSTHGTSEAGLTEEGDESDSSEESLNVPVFGLGVVKVDGLKSQQRKAESPHSQSRKREAGRSEVASHDNRLPKSFLRFELKGCIIDSHQLNGGGLSFLDTKLQICGASVSPTGALLKSMSSSMAMPPQLLEVGRADSSSLPTESFLSRSAEHLLTNYTLLRCDDSTLGEALHTSSSANMEVEPVKGAALEARFISVSNKLSQDSDIANEVNADQPNSNGEAPQSSDGLSMDIRVGVTEVNWSEKVVDHLHGFLTEAPFNSTGKLFEMTSSGSFESSKQKETRTSLVREPSHCVHYYYVDCAAITTTHFRDITSVRVEPDISGVFSAATAMQVKQPQLAYSMVEMSEECAKKYAQSASKLANGTTEDVCVRWSSFEVKHTDRFGFPGGSDSEFLPSRSVDHHLCSALDGMNGCIFRIDGLSLQSSITTAFLERLHCASVKVLVDSSFEAKASSINATLSLESIHALSEFLNAAQLLTKLGKAQALELHLGNQQQLNSASRHSCLQMAGALEMCTSDLAFQASAQGAREEKGIEHTAVFAVRGNLGLLSLKKSDSTSVNRFPIISTRHAAGSNLSRTSCPFISGNVKIENPSNKFLDSVRQLSGYQILSKRLTTQTNPPSDLAVPTLRCDASIGEAHFDVQNATLAFAALGAMSSSFFDAIAMQSSSSTKALKKNAHVAAPLDMTEFAVVPNIQTSAWLLWLSPHLLFKSPEVSVVKASASEQMHLDCFMTMTGSKLLGNTVP